MNIKTRLTLMNFMQFFVWGSWLLTIGAYWFQINIGQVQNLAQSFPQWELHPFLCLQLPGLSPTDG